MSKFHKRKIKKGVYGELSKIEEELQEAYDAQEQDQDLMLLIELSDMIGAIEGVSKKYGINLEQLMKFSKLRSKVAIEEEIEKNYETKEQNDDQIDTIQGLAEKLLNGSVLESHLKYFWNLKDDFSIQDIQKLVNEVTNKKIDPIDEFVEMIEKLTNIIEKKEI